MPESSTFEMQTFRGSLRTHWPLLSLFVEGKSTNFLFRSIKKDIPNYKWYPFKTICSELEKKNIEMSLYWFFDVDNK